MTGGGWNQTPSREKPGGIHSAGLNRARGSSGPNPPDFTDQGARIQKDGRRCGMGCAVEPGVEALITRLNL